MVKKKKKKGKNDLRSGKKKRGNIDLRNGKKKELFGTENIMIFIIYGFTVNKRL